MNNPEYEADPRERLKIDGRVRVCMQHGRFGHLTWTGVMGAILALLGLGMLLGSWLVRYPNGLKFFAYSLVFPGMAMIIYHSILLSRREKVCRWRISVGEGFRPRHCIRCKYDLQGSEGPRCPECGARFRRRKPR